MQGGSCICLVMLVVSEATPAGALKLPCRSARAQRPVRARCRAPANSACPPARPRLHRPRRAPRGGAVAEEGDHDVGGAARGDRRGDGARPHRLRHGCARLEVRRECARCFVAARGLRSVFVAAGLAGRPSNGAPTASPRRRSRPRRPAPGVDARPRARAPPRRRGRGSLRRQLQGHLRPLQEVRRHARARHPHLR